MCGPARSSARQTCRLAGSAGQAQDDPDLLEWDDEGLYTAQAQRLRPDWMLHRDGCPGGESPAQVAGHADRLIARLKALQGDVALFSHGQFGAVLAARWAALPVATARHFPLAPSKSTVARYLQAFQSKPHRVESFKLSTDPLFIDSLRERSGRFNQTCHRSRACACADDRPSPPRPQTQHASATAAPRDACACRGAMEAGQDKEGRECPGEKNKECMLKFENPAATDAIKPTLCMFYRLPGNFIAANFTGQ